ncbi:Uncharacterised protein [uncultured archaeon]|nr:Uncharacterised protein [uncultured archaeon]
MVCGEVLDVDEHNNIILAPRLVLEFLELGNVLVNYAPQAGGRVLLVAERCTCWGGKGRPEGYSFSAKVLVNVVIESGECGVIPGNFVLHDIGYSSPQHIRAGFCYLLVYVIPKWLVGCAILVGSLDPDVLHQDNVLVLAESNLVVLVVHCDLHIGGINGPDGHLIVGLLRLERGHCVGYLELTVDCGDVGVRSGEGVLEVNSYLNNV